jgi:transposase-like protein
VEAILAAKQFAADAERLLKEVTVDALVRGASFPELSKATGISTSTLQRWVRELGATPAGRRREGDWKHGNDVWLQRIQAMKDQGIIRD